MSGVSAGGFCEEKITDARSTHVASGAGVARSFRPYTIRRDVGKSFISRQTGASARPFSYTLSPWASLSGTRIISTMNAFQS